MLLGTGVDYYIVPLEGIDITCKSGVMIRSPIIKFKLLSYPDLNKIELLSRSGKSAEYIYEEVCNNKIECILGHEGQVIDFDNSPAGVLIHLGRKLVDNSRTVLEDLVTSYSSLAESVTILDQIAMIVSNHSNNTYEYTKDLPVDELLKRYAICVTCFNYSPIEPTEEDSKVGDYVGW